MNISAWTLGVDTETATSFLLYEGNVVSVFERGLWKKVEAPSTGAPDEIETFLLKVGGRNVKVGERVFNADFPEVPGKDIWRQWFKELAVTDVWQPPKRRGRL